MAKLNSGTRIYGTANVDTSIGIGSTSVINATGFYTTGIVNAASYTIGSNYIANTTGFYTTGIVNAASYTIGSNYIANTTGIYTTGIVNALSYSVGNTFTANTSQLYFNANVVIASNRDIIFSGNSGIYANNSFGTLGQVLTSNATSVYWSTVSAGGGGGFSNGQSISVANLAITGSLTVANSVGTAGQALVSTGTGVQWGALSPGYNYSSQFGGGNQWLGVTSSNAAFGFGTGDFTVEGWFYPTLNPTNGVGTIFEFRSTANASACTMRINASLQLMFYDGPANVETAFTTRTVSLNTWQHVAFVRIGNTVYGYINGLLAGSVGVTSNLGSSQPFYIGTNQTPSYNYYGLASNLRVIKGTGIYTGAFTPPTSPLSAISGTSILTCNAITPTSDSSTNNFQLTNTNGVTTTATQSPFTSTTVSIPTSSLTAVNQQFTGDGSTTTFSVAGGYTPNAIAVYYNGLKLRNGSDVTVTSGSTIVFAIAPQSGALIDVVASVPTTYSSITPVSYSTSFSGSSQWLSIAYSATPMSLTGDYTIEAWIYPTAFTNGSSANGLSVLSQGGSQGTDVNGVSIQLTSAGVIQNITKNVNGNVLSTKSGVPLNTWSHIAVCRIGSSITIYVNGNPGNTVSLAGTITNASFPLYIGRPSTVDYWGYFQGYISNVRVVNGVGVYTGAFTPPQTPLAIVQSATSPSISAITGTQTSLLTCNGPTIIDGSTNAFTITNNGSAPVSTSIVPTFTNVTSVLPTVVNPFYENSINVSADYTITTGKNAMSAGPITINTGITVTVPSGSTWTIV